MKLGRKIGDEAVLRCWSAEDHEGVRMTWIKQYNDTFQILIVSLANTTEVKHLNGTTVMTAGPGGKLQITNAVVADSGKYVCRGYINAPEGGEKLVFSDSTTLIVGSKYI